MLSCDVCLSVCPSVTLAYCVETTELIIKQFALNSGSLRTPHMEHIFRDPSSGALNKSHVEKLRFAMSHMRLHT